MERDARQEREREFYDREYAEDGRAPDKYYEASQPAYDYYDSLLEVTPSGARALEYGCGTGTSAASLARRGIHVVGIDISPVAIERARTEIERLGLTDMAEFKVMDAENLEFEDDSFDLVCGGAILHHLDLERALAEVARTLRPSGRAVFLEPLGHNPAIRLYRRLTPQHRTPDEHPLTESDLAMARRRFGRVETRYFNLLSLAATPLRGRSSFEGAVRRLTAIDQRLFRRFPPLRKHAWMVVLEFSDPH